MLIRKKSIIVLQTLVKNKKYFLNFISIINKKKLQDVDKIYSIVFKFLIWKRNICKSLQSILNERYKIKPGSYNIGGVINLFYMRKCILVCVDKTNTIPNDLYHHFCKSKFHEVM